MTADQHLPSASASVYHTGWPALQAVGRVLPTSTPMPAHCDRVTVSEISNAAETGVRLVDRLIRGQKAFIQLGGDVHGTGEIAKAAGLDDSASSRILQSDVFDRVGHGKYQLGFTTAYLGVHALAHAPAKDDHTPAVLEDLRNAADGGLVFHFMPATVEGAQRLCIDMAVGDSDLVVLAAPVIAKRI